MLRRFPIRAARNDDKWCASSYPIDRVVLADVMKDIEGLQQTFNKQKTAVEKLLPEIALLKRKSKCWRTCTTSRCKTRGGILAYATDAG